MRHKLLEDQLDADAAEHDIEQRAHSPTRATDEANFLPTISLHRELDEDGMSGVVGPGADHIIQTSMFFNQALRR